MHLLLRIADIAGAVAWAGCFLMLDTLIKAGWMSIVLGLVSLQVSSDDEHSVPLSR